MACRQRLAAYSYSQRLTFLGATGWAIICHYGRTAKQRAARDSFPSGRATLAINGNCVVTVVGGYVDDNGGFDPYDGGAGYSDAFATATKWATAGGAGDPYGYDGHAEC